MIDESLKPKIGGFELIKGNYENNPDLTARASSVRTARTGGRSASMRRRSYAKS